MYINLQCLQERGSNMFKQFVLYISVPLRGTWGIMSWAMYHLEGGRRIWLQKMLCVCTCLSTRIQAFFLKHTPSHACKHTRTYIYTLNTHTRSHLHTHTRTHARTHTCTHAHAHALTHTHTHTCSRVHAHTHTCIHTSLYSIKLLYHLCLR